MKRQKSHFIGAILLTVLVLFGAGATTAFTGQHEAAIQRIKITATNYAFDAPAQIKAGLVSVTLENKGDEPHHAAFVRLNNGVTVEQLKEAMAKNLNSAFGLVTFAGGPGTVDPHGRQEVVMRLTPGDYVIICFVPDDEDGAPHFARGMVRPITVTADPDQEEVREPKADGTIKLKDFAFDLPAEIKPGRHVWLVENEGPQPHELSLVRLATGKTTDDLKTFFQLNNGARPPFEDVGGFEPIQAGGRGWVILDLTPGVYVAICFVPDPETGQAHADLGMIQSFEVGKDVAAASKQPATSEEIIAQAGDDWVVAENGTYIPAIDQLGHHLDLVYQHFAGNAFKDAAREIRAGATFLKGTAAKLEEKKAKTALDAAASDLMTLADRVEQGRVTSATELNAAFEKAFQVDVENRWIGLKAKEAEASELKRALIRANAGPREDSIALTRDLQKLSDELIAGKTPEANQIGKILEDIGQQIKALGAELETITHASPEK